MQRHVSKSTLARMALFLGGALALATATTGCSADASEEPMGETHDELRVTSSFVSKGTGYYPHSSRLEGGFKDRIGKPLTTLQQFLAGGASYVSVAMDTKAFKYGTRLRIKELDAKYGRSIVFRVTDTGGAFRGKGRSRIDICTKNEPASLDPTINGTLHIDVISDEPGSPDSDSLPADDEEASTSSGGAACSSDGDCNPGNDGSGQICSSGTCVDGCRSNAQCPGSTTCKSGLCR